MRSRPLPRIAATMLALALAVPARAATFVVDLTADVVDGNPGDGVCDAGGQGCSLRAAIQEANHTPGTDTITVPAGIYTLQIAGAGEDAGATGDLDVTDPVVIEGAGAGQTILDGGGLDRVLDLAADTTVRRLTIRNGDAGAEDGGGIRATPPISSIEPITITVEDAVISGNDALNGGGIANQAFSTLELRRSTLTDNRATSGGGGGLDQSGDDVVLENDTISANFAIDGDGIRCDSAPLEATDITVVDDKLSGGEITLSATLLDNGTTGSCASGTSVTSNGGNLEHGTSCGFTGASDVDGVDPLVYPLGDYGGETPTHAIAAGSPAVDALASCPLGEDQRGVARPQDGDSSGTAACDIGAYEAEPGVIPTTTTTTPGTTTTTTLPACTSEATFASTECRIQSLAIRFAGASEPVKLSTRLSKLLAKAGDRLPVAQDAQDLGKRKRARRQVGKAARFVKRFAAKLGGRKGPKIVVDDGARAILAGDATALQADLLLLRDGIQ
jgi:CSLREA domain-containing protein